MKESIIIVVAFLVITVFVMALVVFIAPSPLVPKTISAPAVLIFGIILAYLFKIKKDGEF